MRTPRFATLATALLLTGCAAMTGQEAGLSVAVLGDNLVGEACRAEPATSGQGWRDWALYCGRWEQPSARLTRLQDSGRGSGAARAARWQAEIDERMRCAASAKRPLLAGQANLTLASCRLVAGDWEYVTLDGEVGGARYLGSGTPASVPVLERAVALDAGLAGADEVGVATGAPGGLGSGAAGQLYSLGDVDRFDRLMTLAAYHNNLQNFAEAERLYRQAIQLREGIAGPDDPGLVLPLAQLALQLSNQERFAEAAGLFARADAIGQGPGTVVAATRLPDFYRAIDLSNQGRAAAALTRLRVINAELRRAIADGEGQAADLRSVVLRNDPVLLARGDLAIGRYLEGRLLLDAGELAGAEAALVEARSLVAVTPVVPLRLVPSLIELEAELARRRGQPRRAAELYGNAVAAWVALYRSGRPESLARLLHGDVLAGLGEADTALAEYRMATTALRQARETVGYPQMRGYFRLLDARAAAAGDGAQTLYREMFEARQLVRGGVTAQSIADAAARLASGDDAVAQLIRDYQDARNTRDEALQRVSLLGGEEARAKDAATRAALREQQAQARTVLAAAEADVERLDAQVQTAFAPYNQLLDTPVTTADVTAVLGPGEVLVDVLSGDDATYVFLVQGNRLSVARQMTGEAELEGLVERLRRSLSTDSGTLPPFELEAARAIYARVFEPLAPLLEARPRLTFALSGPLASLPPQILARPGTAGDAATFDYSGVDWLIGHATIAVVPSPRSLVDLRAVAKATAAPLPFLGFGDFVPGRVGVRPPVDAREACGLQLLQSGGLTPLPETAGEVRAVAAALGAGPDGAVLGRAFTERTIEELPLARYRVLYFATHGLLPGELDCLTEPALVVSGPTEATGTGAGLLPASAIAGLRLDADLVVLSACNTAGPGAELGGESLSGLARAFFFAGARALIVSHWAVSSEETVRLMTATFGAAGIASEAVAGTLREAQLELLETGRQAVLNPARFQGLERYWTHPFFWGPFTVVGGQAPPGGA